MYIKRLASKEIFSPSNKIHREVGRAKDLSAPQDKFSVLRDVHRVIWQRSVQTLENVASKQVPLNYPLAPICLHIVIPEGNTVHGHYHEKHLTQSMQLQKRLSITDHSTFPPAPTAGIKPNVIITTVKSV